MGTRDNDLEAGVRAVAETLVRFGGGDLQARAERTGDRSAVDELAFVANLTMDELAARFAESARHTAQLEAANQRLQQLGKLAALGELSAVLGHELTRDQRECIEMVLDSARVMQAVIRNLRRYTREDEVSLTPLPATAPVDAALGLARRQLERLGITSFVRAATELPDVGVDLPLMQQVFLKLLACARDSLISVPGGVPRRILVEITANEHHVVYLVSDNGSGIAEDLREAVFESVPSSHAWGTGDALGLALARGFLVRHGGTLALAPADRGTCFVLRLPAAATA